MSFSSSSRLAATVDEALHPFRSRFTPEEWERLGQTISKAFLAADCDGDCLAECRGPIGDATHFNWSHPNAPKRPEEGATYEVRDGRFLTVFRFDGHRWVYESEARRV